MLSDVLTDGQSRGHVVSKKRELLIERKLFIKPMYLRTDKVMCRWRLVFETKITVNILFIGGATL